LTIYLSQPKLVACWRVCTPALWLGWTGRSSSSKWTPGRGSRKYPYSAQKTVSFSICLT